MTRDDIIRLAREAGGYAANFNGRWSFYMVDLERFAELVAAAEREACAKVCEDWPNGRDDVCLIAEAIRARGEK